MVMGRRNDDVKRRRRNVNEHRFLSKSKDTEVGHHSVDKNDLEL